MIQWLSSIGRRFPKTTIFLLVAMTLISGFMALLPSIWPQFFPKLNSVHIDTDPENMLSDLEPVRLFHQKMKRQFDSKEMMVLGVINDENPQGVFNAKSLQNIYHLSAFIQTLHWPSSQNPDVNEGVVGIDLISPSTVDNIQQGDLGEVQFEWLMKEPPKTDQEAQIIRDKMKRIPFLNGTVLSDDGLAICLYLPITSKDVSYQVAQKLYQYIEKIDGQEKYHLTGLPVANDTFGVEMFKQMAISAPIAMLVIFIMMYYFFRSLSLIIAPMIIALLSVIITMGLLVITGQTIHIMSSMIPIFIMPIAVLDSVHILSEFYDVYQKKIDRVSAVQHVMQELFKPMFYTSLTSFAGFASLALTPIPPVRVFGLFVALGVFFAWVFTIFFIPAYIMLLSEKTLQKMSASAKTSTNDSLLTRFLKGIGQWSYRKSGWVLTITLLILVFAIFGVQKITINDNPVYWFKHNHPIRIADSQLNQHFGGTYMAYLNLKVKNNLSVEEKKKVFKDDLLKFEKNNLDLNQIHFIISSLLQKIDSIQSISWDEVKEQTNQWIQQETDHASDTNYDTWDEIYWFSQEWFENKWSFKNPDYLNYVDGLQIYLNQHPYVGKVNSLVDLVKTVYRELMGSEEYFLIPDSSKAIAQSIITYQGSHRPGDLWHFTTDDYQQLNLWVQLKSGNNKDMLEVVKTVDNYFKKQSNQFLEIDHQWSGLTYINVVWQQKMVQGMLKAFLGSFLIVFVMMSIFFRSCLWGILSMIPLSVTILTIYGSIGWLGKDYDMPIAVLSSLTLGLAVDFAIHFLSRTQELVCELGSWKNALPKMFDSPARAIARNAIVVAVGFSPLLLAPLVPYITVGIFLSTILAVASITTFFVLTILVKYFENRLSFGNSTMSFMTKIILGMSLFYVVLWNTLDYLKIQWAYFHYTYISISIMIGVICGAIFNKKERRL